MSPKILDRNTYLSGATVFLLLSILLIQVGLLSLGFVNFRSVSIAEYSFEIKPPFMLRFLNISAIKRTLIRTPIGGKNPSIDFIPFVEVKSNRLNVTVAFPRATPSPIAAESIREIVVESMMRSYLQARIEFINIDRLARERSGGRSSGDLTASEFETGAAVPDRSGFDSGVVLKHTHRTETKYFRPLDGVSLIVNLCLLLISVLWFRRDRRDSETGS